MKIIKHTFFLLLLIFISARAVSQCENAELNVIVDSEMNDHYLLATPSGGMIHGSWTKFIVRNGAGEVIFSQSFSPGTAQIQDVFVDQVGSIYVCGSYFNSINLGNGFTFSGSTTSAVFFAKYSSLGTTLWAHSSYVPGLDEGADAAYEIAVDPLGRCYVSGYLSGEFQLDPEFPEFGFLTNPLHFLAGVNAITGEYDWFKTSNNVVTYFSYPHPDGGIIQLMPVSYYSDDDTTWYDGTAQGMIIRFNSLGTYLEHVNYYGNIFARAFHQNTNNFEISLLLESDQEFTMGNVSNTCYGGHCLQLISVDANLDNIEVRELMHYMEEDIPFNERLAIAMTNDGEYYIGMGLAQESNLEFYNLDTYMDEGFVLAHFDEDLGLDWYTMPGTTESNDAECHGIVVDEEGCYVFVENSCAATLIMHGEDYDSGNFISQYSCEGEWCGPVIEPEIPDGVLENEAATLNVFVQGDVMIIQSSELLEKIEVFDSNGRMVYSSEELAINNYELLINNWSSGLYLVSGNGVTRRVMVP